MTTRRRLVIAGAAHDSRPVARTVRCPDRRANGAISDQTDQIRDALCARDQGRVARANE
jgi:hypothetical protein